MELKSDIRRKRRALVELSKSLFDRGYIAGSAGNISVRAGVDKVLATPSGACLGRLSEESLALLSLEGEQIKGPRASKETKFHLALYNNDPACGSVVHLHSTWVTLLSCRADLDTEAPIRPFTPYYVMKIGCLQVVPYYPPGDERLAEAMKAWAGQRNAFLLRNHGGIVTAGTLTKAVDLAEELEETAKLYCLLNKNNIHYLSEAEITQLRGR
ncbi:MAG: aldolase [Spirochaetaceae bacterium]|nr:aldolase [Spirochaetaceae bacterium]MCF7948913.1 aldolase [Spirochaetia bacterium]MCF7951078.1 aldolase [Spirochaetaceae bacterium]